jgi:hypothetical protein
MRCACSRGPASTTDTLDNSNAAPMKMRHMTRWEIDVAKVGIQCILLFMIPSSRWFRRFESGRNYTTKKIAA